MCLAECEQRLLGSPYDEISRPTMNTKSLASPPTHLLATIFHCDTLNEAFFFVDPRT